MLTSNPSTQEAEAVRSLEFEAIPVYRMSSKMARFTYTSMSRKTEQKTIQQTILYLVYTIFLYSIPATSRTTVAGHGQLPLYSELVQASQGYIGRPCFTAHKSQRTGMKCPLMKTCHFLLLTFLSSSLILSSNPIPTILRITRQRKTQQNLSLSKQDEDHWAQIGSKNLSIRKTAHICVHTNWLLSSSSGGACRTKWKTLYISKRSVCLQTFTGSCSVGSINGLI